MASDAFLIAGAAMAKRLGIYWPDLLTVMNTESGISSHATNGKYFGLIQEGDLASLGWNGTPAQFLALSDVDQLPYVERFLQRYASYGLDSIGRIHQALIAPATLGLGGKGDPNYVIYRKNGTRWGGAEAGYYSSNKLFDTQGKGYFTVGDMQAWDVAHASLPSSPYQKALSRLVVLLPEYAKKPMSTASKVVAIALGFGGLGLGIWALTRK